jgi:hypothetical protein
LVDASSDGRIADLAQPMAARIAVSVHRIAGQRGAPSTPDPGRVDLPEIAAMGRPANENDAWSDDIVVMLIDLGARIRAAYADGSLDAPSREIVDEMLLELAERGDGAPAFGSTIIRGAADRLAATSAGDGHVEAFIVLVGGAMAAALAIRKQRLRQARAKASARAGSNRFRHHARNWRFVKVPQG